MMPPKQIKKPTYRTSQDMRTRIANWEGSDFAGLNKLFGGDAIAAKELELNRALGDSMLYMDQDTYDAAMSYWYNTARKSGMTMANAWKAYAADPTDENFNLFKNSFSAGYNWKGMSGLRARRDYERGLVKPINRLNPYSIQNTLFPKYEYSKPVKNVILKANNYIESNYTNPVLIPNRFPGPSIIVSRPLMPDLKQLIEQQINQPVWTVQ